MREVRSELAVRSLHQLRKGAAQRAVVVADDELGPQQRRIGGLWASATSGSSCADGEDAADAADAAIAGICMESLR